MSPFRFTGKWDGGEWYLVCDPMDESVRLFRSNGQELDLSTAFQNKTTLMVLSVQKELRSYRLNAHNCNAEFWGYRRADALAAVQANSRGDVRWEVLDL